MAQQQHGTAAVPSPRELEVRAAIAGVRDPEIDESVAALNFVVGVEVAGDVARVSLRLPTFWCPANFVYLMAAEMRRAVLSLPWARVFQLRLVDHFAADEINRAMSEGLGFAEAFPAHAGDELGELRRNFDGKAFLMRQGAVVSNLRRSGMSDGSIVETTADAIDRMAAGDDELAAAWAAYREKFGAVGLALGAQGRVVVDLDGAPIAAADLAGHLRRIRGVTTSATANGEMCRMLMATRSGAGCGVHGGGVGRS
jgi:metal-sulfur cluster biosynthetic enzyme